MFDKAPSDDGICWWYWAEVTRIIDGDTIDVTLDKGLNDFSAKKRIRFAFIDCPDKDLPAKHAATDNLKTMVNVGDKVLLRTEKDDTGAYGRLLAQVFSRGVNLCRAQLDQGHAKLWESGVRW